MIYNTIFSFVERVLRIEREIKLMNKKERILISHTTRTQLIGGKLSRAEKI